MIENYARTGFKVPPGGFTGGFPGRVVRLQQGALLKH